MATTIVMPQLGESVAEGVIGQWMKHEGDPIAKDEAIVEVVTDKVNAEIPSPVAGVLLRISAAEGETVAVGQEIAVIGEAGESAGPPGGAGGETSVPESPVQPPVAENRDVPASSMGASAIAPQAVSGAPSAVLTRPTEKLDSPNRVVRSSPLVQRLAAEHNVDISAIPGTGIGGRVSKRDILQFIEGGQVAAVPAPSPASTSPAAPTFPAAQPPATAQAPAAAPSPPAPLPGARPGGVNEQHLPISPVRRMIAEHMAKSKFTIPHATSMIEVDMTPVARFREAEKGAWRQANGFSLSYMAFVALATVESLRQHPLVNSEWGGDKIIVKQNVNLGLAVAAPNGLIVPNIKNADRLGLSGLAFAVNDLTVRARDGKLTPDDVSGGTFTLNNTGAIGSVWSVSIINFPQAGILSADSIVKRLRVMPDESIAIRHIMNLSMSFDHRVLDGAEVSSFMQFIRRRLESWPADHPM